MKKGLFFAEVGHLSLMRNSPQQVGWQYLLFFILLFDYFCEGHVVHSMFPFLHQTPFLCLFHKKYFPNFPFY